MWPSSGQQAQRVEQKHIHMIGKNILILKTGKSKGNQGTQLTKKDCGCGEKKYTDIYV